MDRLARSLEMLRAVRGSREMFGQEREVLELEELRARMLRSEVHNVLVFRHTAQAEEEIQRLVKEVHQMDMPVCEVKIEKFRKALGVYQSRGDVVNVQKCYEYLQRWVDVYEDFWALVAFRSLEHFALFMEWDKEDNDKVWKYSLDPYDDGGYTGVNKPFFYYFNQMVLKKDIKFISKQQATGTGKSYSNAFAISWVLGIDPNNDVLLVLGNPTLVASNVKNIVDIIKNPRFVKVFPQFEKYLDVEEDKKGNRTVVVSDNIFSVCRAKEGELTLADSDKPLNLKVISKDTSIDGIRVRFLFLDDVCRSKDAGNMGMHEKDITMYWTSWWKRNYNTEDFYVVAGGTAYSIFDILSTLINYYSKGKMKKSAINKYTYLSMDDKCVFIKVPKIDTDFDRSTYPQKFSYEEAIKIKERDYRSFMAMEQQTPLPPENSPFYVENIESYDVIPHEDVESECCWASLDSARVGFDYNSMPIFVKIGEKFYLKDCLYLNEPMDNVYPKIVDKIIQHKITKLVIEKNIDVSLKTLLTKLLAEKGVYYCEIIEVYALTKKEEKIYNMEQIIKNYIVFPAQHLYSYASQMGKFMNDVFAFSYTHKNEHDDSIDSIATFCQRMISLPTYTTKAQLLYV